jgi:Zn-dependent protease with chaperone function
MPAARPRVSGAQLTSLVLLLGGAMLGAACAEGSESHIRAGTVIVRDMPGEADRISFYFAEASPEEARRTVADAAVSAGLPNRGIETDEHEGLQRYRLWTTVGERTGFLTRRIDARIIGALDQAAPGELLLALPPAANPPSNMRPASSDLLFKLYRLEGRSAVTYRFGMASLLVMLLVVLAVAIAPYAALRPYAARLERSSLDDTEKVHRIRRTYLGISLLLPMALSPLAWVTGLWLLPDVILSETVPASTRSQGASLFLWMLVLAIPLAAGMIGAYRAVRPVYRKVRRIGQTRWSIGRKIAVGSVMFLPLIVWLILRSVFIDRPLVVVILWFPVLLVLLAFLPWLLARAVARARPKPEVRRRLLEFCRRRGVKVRDVVIVEGRSERVANAAVAGIIPGFIYVFITDHLLERFTEDEVEAVLAHELGHAKQHHLLIKLGAVLGILALWSLLLVAAFALLGDRLSPALVVILTPIVMVVGLLVAHGGVGVILERKADDYAAKTVGVEPTMHALEKLAEVNMAKRRTGPVWNLLTQHPGIDQRIERLRSRPSRQAA